MTQLSLDMKVPTIPPTLFPVGPRIARCMNLLDHLGPPDWRSKIVKERLDIRSSVHCMMGQIYGDYKAGCCELGLDYNTNEPAEYGLNVMDPASPDAEHEFEALRRGWIAALNIRSHRMIKKLQIAA